MNLKRLITFFIFICLLRLEVGAFTIISNEGKPALWPKGVVSYRFNTNPSGYFSGGHDASGTVTDEFAPIRSAFATWMNVPGINLSISELASTTKSPSSNDRDNIVMWVRTGWRNLSFRPPSNALAVTLLSFDSDTGAIDDADIYFNAENFKWAVVDSGSEYGYIDVGNIATHEIGHFLGLDHSSEDLFESEFELEDATMYFAASAGETSRRTLKDDDISGIHSLYGTSQRGIPKISSVEVVSDTSGITEYRIRGENFNEYTSFVLTKRTSSELDAVARYRTVVSSNEVVARFDTAGMSTGQAQLVALNDPDHAASYSLNVTGLGLDSTQASSGGGGCSLSLEEKSVSSLGFWLILSLATFGVLILRRVILKPLRVRADQSSRSFVERT